MKLAIRFKYWEQYFPTPRHRKLRSREMDGSTEVDVPEVNPADAPVALIAHYFEEADDIRIWNRRLWSPVMVSLNGTKKHSSIKQLVLDLERPNGSSTYDSQEEATLSISERAAEYIILNKQVWKVTDEPVYTINTFGMGNNHGGTCLSITKCCTEYLFNALEYEAARKRMNMVAESRGDTHSIMDLNAPSEDSYNWIEVIIPETVKAMSHEAVVANNLRNIAYKHLTEVFADTGILPESLPSEFVDCYISRLKETECYNVHETCFSDEIRAVYQNLIFETIKKYVTIARDKSNQQKSLGEDTAYDNDKYL